MTLPVLTRPVPVWGGGGGAAAYPAGSLFPGLGTWPGFGYIETSPEVDATVVTSLNRIYLALPDHYLAADAANGDYPLYRYLAGVATELGNVDALLERFDFDGATEPKATSDLVDPVTADAMWLRWLGQLVGVVDLNLALTVEETRDSIRYASAGWRAGTKDGIATAARVALQGTRFAQIYDHSAFEPGDGTEWDVLIVTRASETPAPAEVLNTVLRRNAKPAGVVLHHRTYESSWDTVESTYTSWNAIEAALTWNRVQEAGL